MPALEAVPGFPRTTNYGSTPRTRLESLRSPGSPTYYVFLTMFSARFSLLLAGLLVLGTLVATPLKAQISVKATPYSFRATLDEAVPTYTLPAERLPVQTPQGYQQDENGERSLQKEATPG